MYPDPEVRFEVEDNHPPSVWRNTWTPKLRPVEDPVED